MPSPPVRSARASVGRPQLRSRQKCGAASSLAQERSNFKYLNFLYGTSQRRSNGTEATQESPRASEGLSARPLQEGAPGSRGRDAGGPLRLRPPSGQEERLPLALDCAAER